MDDRLGMHHHVEFFRRHAEQVMASINSKPLFIIVAESTVILGPMDQLG